MKFSLGIFSIGYLIAIAHCSFELRQAADTAQREFLQAQKVKHNVKSDASSSDAEIASVKRFAKTAQEKWQAAERAYEKKLAEESE